MTPQLSALRDASRALVDSRECAVFREIARADAAALAVVDDRPLALSRAALAKSRSRLRAAPLAAKDRKQLELAHLRQADAHIAGANRHIERQREIIAHLASYGAPTAMAERLLDALLTTRAAMESHRGMIHQQLGG